MVIFNQIQKVEKTFLPDILPVLLKVFWTRSCADFAYHQFIGQNLINDNFTRWSEQTSSRILSIFSSVHQDEGLPLRGLSYSFWKYRKPPKNLGSWQNTISVDQLKINESFRSTMLNSVTNPDSMSMLEIDANHF